MLDPPDRVKGVQNDGVSADQGVEKMPQAGRRLVLGGGRDGQVAKEPSGQAERDAVQFHVLTLGKIEKPSDGAAIGLARLGVGDPCREELIVRKAGRAAGALQDRRERLRGDIAAYGLEGGEIGQRVGHNHCR